MLPSSSSKHASNTPRRSEQPGSAAHIQHAEKSLNRAQSHLDQASTLAEQGACSALFAHEVNNLMTQVGGRAQLALLHRDRPELTTKALELAIHASNQIAQLAETLMSMDESQSVTTPASDEVDDADGMANASHASVAEIHHQALEYIAQQDIASYRFEISDLAYAQTIQAPSVVLGQVLLNLYLNAIRAIEESDRQPTGLIAIRLLAAQARTNCSTGNNSESTGEQIEIVIEDTGVGMPKHIIESLAIGLTNSINSGASADQSIPNDQQQNHPRHGFGLKICQGLLNQVGGSLDAQSIIGQGTKMTITLPIRSDRSAA